MIIIRNKILNALKYYFTYSETPEIMNDLVSIKGDCKLNYKVKRLPVKFSSVTGDFIISDNSLTSLEGAPSYVGGNFDCNNNNLTSLKGSPTHVGRHFNCSGNKFVSLEGAPIYIGRSFDCSNNELTSLKGSPSIVGGMYICDKNELDSLYGLPMILLGGLSCFGNNLTTLDGAPSIIKGWFECSGNNLVSLNGIPKSINGAFYIAVFPHTPLLKILNVPGINEFRFFKENSHISITELENIFNKYYGKKNSILLAGFEMIRLGYGSNARL